MRRKPLIAAAVLVLLATLVIGLPWFAACTSYRSASGYLGVENDKQIQCVYVDKTHFNAYKTVLWFDNSLSIIGKDGGIYCNGRRIEFPAQKNVALLRGPDDMIFVELGPKYFQEAKGHSEVLYILGKVPHFKEKNMGMIDLQKVKEEHAMWPELDAFLAMGP